MGWYVMKKVIETYEGHPEGVPKVIFSSEQQMLMKAESLQACLSRSG